MIYIAFALLVLGAYALHRKLYPLAGACAVVSFTFSLASYITS